MEISLKEERKQAHSDMLSLDGQPGNTTADAPGNCRTILCQERLAKLSREFLTKSFQLLSQNTLTWLAYQQDLTAVEAEKPKAKASADSVPDGGQSSSAGMVAFSLCHHMGEWLQGPLGPPLGIPFLRTLQLGFNHHQRSQLFIPSHRGKAFLKFICFYLFKSQSDKKERSFILLIYFPMTITYGAGPGQSQDPGT